MEHQDSFDLNHAINQWRERLSLLPAFREKNLHELEAHLRDSIAILQGRNLSPEDSFVLATHRLGTAEQLAAEYSKVNRRAIWLERAMWMLAGQMLLGFTTGLSHSIGTAIVFFGPRFAEGSVWQSVVGTFATLLIFVLTLLFIWRMLNRPFGFIQAQLKKMLRHGSLIAMQLLLAMGVMASINYLPVFFIVKYHGVEGLRQVSIASEQFRIASAVFFTLFTVVTFAWLAQRYFRSQPDNSVQA